MTIVLAFECTVDGKLPDGKLASTLLFEHVARSCAAILSENYDGTEDWAVIIDRVSLIEEKP